VTEIWNVIDPWAGEGGIRSTLNKIVKLRGNPSIKEYSDLILLNCS